MQDDAELVELALGGDQSAFAELYERYFDRVYDFLARMVRDRDEAADLAQDTFVRAINNLGSLSKGGSFKSWLFTIARNTALNRLERASRVQPLERRAASDDDDSFEMDVIDEDRYGNPEEAAEVKSYASLVWEAAASLDPRQYAVLDLSVRQQLNTEEMAEALGVSKNNAYVMVNRMKKGLEDAIGALVLLREGRRQCNDLDAMLASLQVGEMTPELRRAIDRHASKCDACSERRRSLASPFGIFAGFGFLQPAGGAKAAIFENLSATFGAVYGNGASSASEAASLGRGIDSEAGLPGLSHSATAGLPGAGALPAGNGAGAGRGLDAASGETPGGSWRLKLAAAGVAALLLLGGGLYMLFGSSETSETTEALAGAAGTPAGAGALQPLETPSSTTVMTTASPSSGAKVDAPAAPTTPATATATQAATQAASQAERTPTVVADSLGEETADSPAGVPPATEQPAIHDPPPPATATRPPAPPTSVPATATATTIPPSPTPCVVTVTSDPTSLDYGTNDSSRQLALRAHGCAIPVTYRIETAAGGGWVTPLPANGTIPANGSAAVTVRIDRNALVPGDNATQLTVHIVAGSMSGAFVVPVQASVERMPSTPGGFAAQPTSTPDGRTPAR